MPSLQKKLVKFAVFQIRNTHVFQIINMHVEEKQYSFSKLKVVEKLSRKLNLLISESIVLAYISNTVKNSIFC